ncbi:propionyl-CoA synthetase [Pontibacter diazotrophicus]|uniref:Propionyl-CoA synthetase n=1 Tax=Pontibacter diazotrophicus TaxID=1400979 RepID=A0A3D8LBD3_9BACT|nr:propionyl-CoA synthetase [Pontibacter diazotrophicus]RDV14606.1 propionyl-CoA synthetase [Pontibacter diazotrophicus]
METHNSSTKDYLKAYKQSIENPEAFWGDQAARLAWYEQPQQVLSTDENGFYRWFKGGKLNTAYLALDFHVENGRADQTALIYDSPVTDTIKKYSYRELRDLVAHFAGALQGLGVEKGDTVVIYMPVIPEAVVAMLACARLGAIHSVVFGGFAPHELSVRIDDARPKVVVSASCGIEFDRVIPSYKPLLDKALQDSMHKPGHTVIFQRPQVAAAMQPGRDLDFADLLQQAEPADCVPVDATDPLYILYTSGTTGKPKGIVRDNGGHAVALKYSMKAVYGVDPGETFWAASDVGWAVGHSYLVYGPLIHGCTTILFEGKPVRTPDAGTFWRVIQEHHVKVLFTAPTAFRAIKKEDPEGEFKKKYDLPSLKYLFLAGERCDVATYYWAKDMLKVPVIDHWWQTESGWPMVANMVGLEEHAPKPGSAGKPVCGYDVQILNEKGKQLIPNQEGYVAVKLPLPPGCLPTLWQDDERFKKAYLERYPGYYLTGDGGYIDEDNYVYIMGRIDDVINVSGHRLSTGEMEEMVASHKAVAECAVVGIADELRGQRPIGLVVLKDGQTISEAQLEEELVAHIREKIGAVACFKNVLIVNRLPKTRSGKILRKIMRHIADGTPYTVPSTIDDPAILTEIHDRLKERKTGNAFAS